MTKRKKQILRNLKLNVDNNRMKKLVTLNGGEIFAIPLFLSDEKSTKSFARNKFTDKGKEFVFCRIIEDRQGSGYLTEIFDLVGNFDESLDNILQSKRLFQPIAITGMAITTKRWRKVHLQEDYDKERDSKYSEIKLVLGSYDDLSLWQNGQETEISETEAENYERWQIWMPSQLEKRIIKELFGEVASKR